jgi:hypothetical protein
VTAQHLKKRARRLNNPLTREWYKQYENEPDHRQFRRAYDEKERDDDDDWPEPLDIFGSEIATRDLRKMHVPDALYPFIIETSERMGADPVGAALCCLVSCASVISNEWKIQPCVSIINGLSRHDCGRQS